MFLAHFGLDSLDNLPGLDELRATGLLDIGPGRSARRRRNSPMNTPRLVNRNKRAVTSERPQPIRARASLRR